MTQEAQKLSPKALENLKRNAELREKDNKFIKLQPAEKRVLEFNPEKIEQVEAEFNGKKSQRYRYTVDSPYHPYSDTRFTINEKGADDIDEKNKKGN